MLYFGSFSLLVSALLLILSALVKRPDPRLHLRDRPRKVGQLTSDKGDVLPGCHLESKSKAAWAKVSRITRRAPRPARVGRMSNAVLRTDLDHTAHTFLGYTDDAKRREKVDAWMSTPKAINWQAEIDEAQLQGQEVHFGSEQFEQVRLLLGEHLPL